MVDTDVVIVGMGPSGLAMAACLKVLGIDFVVLEREACWASLWKLRAYDRLKLHLAKQFCHLPHMPFPDDAPTFVPKDQFVTYLDHYVDHFGIDPVLSTAVEHAAFDEAAGRWRVIARSVVTGEVEEYRSRFLVVATGENSEGRIPDISGLETFPGDVLHSSSYKSGKIYAGKRVLVVGAGNSAMEIAYDLSNHGANTSIVIRSPVHVLSKRMVFLAMVLLKFIGVRTVDSLVMLLAKLRYGDLSKYGIERPKRGPMETKIATGRSATIDVGTINKIKAGEITVVKEVKAIQGNQVEFVDDRRCSFDAIIFGTGYRSTAKKWLKDGDTFLNKEGMPKERPPNHWKGANGVYSVGFGSGGLAAISRDALSVADDIQFILSRKQ